ncbi:hypothetical protein [Arthrobacter sp. AQ5-05]|uniref:P-loop ATPase, Sll1717 family n=1 Tax=Arthrobacter sp. AQ5-05 TaxID=2184581 RepID=UPI0011BF1B50|nr:hypothetical protein [Arthrobacter sp. AQ5-05]
MYSTLLKRTSELHQQGIVLVSAENPRGMPAFKSLNEDTPASELEFVSLWKMYVLSLIASKLDENGVEGSTATEIKSVLASEGLIPSPKASLGVRLKMVLDWVRRSLSPESVEGGWKIDPHTGMATGVTGKITLREPTADEDAKGAVSIDSLLSAANEVLTQNKLTVWVAFDRLDVAFTESHDLEANALRALFKCYLDLQSHQSIVLKIFLRNDIWNKIVDGGFREASHITRHLTISWSQPSLLNLVVSRMLNSPSLLEYVNQDADEIRPKAVLQRKFFDSLVPDKIDVGNNPSTFEWILGRVQDGTKTIAPREVIHLLTETKSSQIAMLERGEDEPPRRELFTRMAFREALPTVSKVRLQQTIYAEFDDVKPWLEELNSEKADQYPESLSRIWKVDLELALQRAKRLVDVGVFEPRGTKAAPRYWVPFLYRPELAVIQGKAQ